jgi:hypothetical protein
MRKNKKATLFFMFQISVGKINQRLKKSCISKNKMNTLKNKNAESQFQKKVVSSTLN